MKAADSERRSLTEIAAGPWPHTLGVLKLIELMTGKKSVAPSGTEQERVAELPLKTPARNHTGPRCPTIQAAPLKSSSGFTEVGIDSAHCHHCAVSSLRSVSEDAFDTACWANALCIDAGAITENPKAVSARHKRKFMVELPAKLEPSWRSTRSALRPADLLTLNNNDRR